MYYEGLDILGICHWCCCGGLVNYPCPAFKPEPQRRARRRVFHKYMSVKKHLGILSIGLASNWVMTWGFDFLLYPFVIFVYGLFLGGLIMMALSFMICYLTMLFYDWSKKDWIGIETIKKIKYYDQETRFGKFIAKMVKKSDPLAMIILSIHFDPFITVAYMRHGAHQYNGLSKRDWEIFISSLVISNLYWILAAYAGITIVEAIWHSLFNHINAMVIFLFK